MQAFVLHFGLLVAFDRNVSLITLMQFYRARVCARACAEGVGREAFIFQAAVHRIRFNDVTSCPKKREI